MNLLWASSFFSIRRSEEEENKHSKSYNHGDQDFEDLHRFVLLELITPDFKGSNNRAKSSPYRYSWPEK
jgi:hypothetical protein